tara:strand:+ start:236 stop:541 length:306 start_codon:yes stop_codon:yes gene_type:complete
MEDNKLIAEFMGMENERHSDGRYLFTTDIDELKGADTRFWEELYFHVSWDWLMPVVQKIEDYLADNVGKVGYFDECLNSNDLEVRYQAVVEFIKQYNNGRM